MTTRAEQARIFNQSIAQGLSEDQALAAAGITDPSLFTYDIDGQLEPAFVGPGLRPNETIVPLGTIIDDEDNEPQFVTQTVSSQTTISSQTSVTGGGTTTRIVQPTQYQDTAASRAAQADADRLAAEKANLSAQLKAEGRTGAEVLRDPRYRELTQQQQAAQTAADSAKTPVPGTGGISVISTPGADSTTVYQNSSPSYIQNNAGIEDPNAQLQAVNRTPAAALPQTTATAPLDDPEAGEYEARQFLLDQQPVESFAPPPVSDDNLAFEPQFDDNLAYSSPPTVFEDPNAGDFEAQQFVTGSQIRSAPQAVTVIDPETGLPVETLESIEARQQFAAQETGVSPYGEEDDPQDLPVDTDTTVEDTEGYVVPENNIPSDRQILVQPTALGGNFVAQFNIDNNWWEIVDADTGEVIEQGIPTEQEAVLLAEEYSVGDPSFAGNADAAGGDPGLTPEQAQQQAAAQAAAEAEARRQAAVAQLRAQATIEAQRKLANEGDWRVKLSLAQNADYLYLDPDINQTGILWPLLETSGVVFPYTPTITTNYNANYTPFDLTHSNYRGYFYQSSNVGDITLECDFTAQDTSEANYLLAVIHFFRSVTKMFYGQDANRGQPPPLVFLQGFGEYQFNLHPCVVSQFTYTTPNDVDYIRARSVNIDGTNLLQRRGQSSLPSAAANASNTRLSNSGLSSGAENSRPAPPTLGTNRPTYVPTKVNISITLLPMQTRQQVSKEFSLKEFANGNLVKRGFW